MRLQKLCFVAMLAALVTIVPAGCNGAGAGGIPVTPGVPDSGMPGSGTPDSGMPDSGMPNAGMPDPVDGAQVPEPDESIAPRETPSVVPSPSSAAPSASPAASVPRSAARAAARAVTVSVQMGDKKIPAGSYLWLASAFQLRDANEASFQMQNSRVTLAGHTYSGPTGIVNVTHSAKVPVTSANDSSIASTFPPAKARKTFMNGLIVYLPGGLPAHQTITWTAHFQSSNRATTGMTIQWQWNAAAYSRFSTSYKSLRIEPVAGTPKNFVKYRIPGVRSEAPSQTVIVN